MEAEIPYAIHMATLTADGGWSTLSATPPPEENLDVDADSDSADLDIPKASELERCAASWTPTDRARFFSNLVRVDVPATLCALTAFKQKPQLAFARRHPRRSDLRMVQLGQWLNSAQVEIMRVAAAEDSVGVVGFPGQSS